MNQLGDTIEQHICLMKRFEAPKMPKHVISVY